MWSENGSRQPSDQRCVGEVLNTHTIMNLSIARQLLMVHHKWCASRWLESKTKVSHKCQQVKGLTRTRWSRAVKETVQLIQVTDSIRASFPEPNVVPTCSYLKGRPWESHRMRRVSNAGLHQIRSGQKSELRRRVSGEIMP